MKTYTKQETVTKPMLVIEHDGDTQSPREWDNLGYFITIERHRQSPDSNAQLERIVRETGGIAGTQQEHIKLIKERMRSESAYKVLAIYAIERYEHGGVAYSIGSSTRGFDTCSCGFYIVTDKTAEVLGIDKKNFEKVIQQELDMYNKWINGEIYMFRLYDTDGNFKDSCGGFYDIEDIRESLSWSWATENLQDYLV